MKKATKKDKAELLAYRKGVEITPDLILAAVRRIGIDSLVVINYVKATQEYVYEMADPEECETMGELGEPALFGDEVYFNRNYSHITDWPDYAGWSCLKTEKSHKLIAHARYLVKKFG